jgi:uncharacterized protein YuzB (UPF0349 family)
MTLVECCLSNVSSDARAVLDESDHEIRESFCLDRCGTCYEQPFLIVDGELSVATSFEDLLDPLADSEEEVER